jgi:hypothetical protein
VHLSENSSPASAYIYRITELSFYGGDCFMQAIELKFHPLPGF